MIWYQDKALWGSIASIVSVVATLPYIVSILKGNTKPHSFSWLIWTISTFIIYFGQVSDDAGAGAWSTLAGAWCAAIVLVLSYVYRGDYTTTRTDWLCLGMALAALPLWYATQTALWAVTLLVVIDVLAYIPTLRKAYHRPHEEQIGMFAIITLRNGMSVYALTHYSWTTLLFPVVTSIANIVLIGMVLWRRSII